MKKSLTMELVFAPGVKPIIVPVVDATAFMMILGRKRNEG